MKIGILTFWKTEDNYGQMLQCYALQTYLQSLGHETFLIRADNECDIKPSLKQQLIGKARTIYRLLPYPLYLIKRAIGSALYTLRTGRLRTHHVNNEFDEFRHKYLHCTDIFSLKQLEDKAPQADAYIVGSDQIWNTQDGIFYLSWADDSVRKIAYAASFGGCDTLPNERNLEYWLNRFDHISVREESGIDICKNAGCPGAKCVIDPTMLINAESYLKIAASEHPKDPYLFIYFLGTRTSINWREIRAFAKAKGLKIIYVASQGQEDKYKHTQANIHQWLALIANAQYVITNSFHGTVFSIIFRKQFMTYPVKGVAIKMNDRITTLLNPLHLNNHIYSTDLNPIREVIDYDYVWAQIQHKQEFAYQFLKESTKCESHN